MNLRRFFFCKNLDFKVNCEQKRKALDLYWIPGQTFKRQTFKRQTFKRQTFKRTNVQPDKRSNGQTFKCDKRSNDKRSNGQKKRTKKIVERLSYLNVCPFERF